MSIQTLRVRQIHVNLPIFCHRLGSNFVVAVMKRSWRIYEQINEHNLDAQARYGGGADDCTGINGMRGGAGAPLCGHW